LEITMRSLPLPGLAFLLLSAFALSVSPWPATAGPAAKAVARPAETFTVGTLSVQRYGDHGRPLILIPGLGSGAWVWDSTVAHLRQDHIVYTVTLAGFDGVPPPAQKTGLMDQADASLLQLIRDHHIDKPVLVGHSLGGTLAIRFASEHAGLLSGVVAVDGLPIFPGAERLDPAQRKAMAARMGARMAQVTPAQFKAQQVGYMRTMGVLDPADADRYGALQARSDPAATAEYMAEDMAADGRPGLKNINIPLLEISPYNAPDFEQAAAASGRPASTEPQKTAYYRQLLSGAPQVKVVSIAPSRHFVMLDQPQRFLETLDSFLAAPAGKP
jgi:pimeloyl-ACP methyl ester carboxylesterase